MSIDFNRDNKRIAKNTLFLYFRSLFLLLISLYTSRITLQVLGVEDFGIYQVVGGVVAMFTMLSSTLASASQRFITFALGKKSDSSLKKVFSTCFTLHLLLGFIIVILLEILGIWFLNNKLNIPTARLEVARWVMQLSIATFFVNVISIPYNVLIIAHEKMDTFAYISILEGCLKLLAVFALLVIKWDKLLLYAILYFIIAIFIRCLYSFYSSAKFPESKVDSLKIDGLLFKEMFAFSGWNLIGTGALVLRNQGVDILLNLFFGVTVNAAKGICNQVQNAVHQLISNFTTSINPQLTQSIAQDNKYRTQSLIFHGGKLAFVLMMIVAVPFIICCDSILSLWLKTVPKYTNVMVVITFIYLLTDTLSRFLINSVLAYGKIRSFAITMGGIKLLAVPLSWLILSNGGTPYTGVIVNTSLQFICMFGELYFSHKFVGTDIVDYLKDVVLKCWITFFMSFLISYAICSLLVDSLLIRGPMSLIIVLFVSYTIGLGKTERTMVNSIIRQIIKHEKN